LAPSTSRDKDRDRDAGIGGLDTKAEVRLGGFPPFHVLGREVETSVLTGRRAVDVARDEGLVGYKPRGGWRAVVE
jgi:hypothetical protein